MAVRALTGTDAPWVRTLMAGPDDDSVARYIADANTLAWGDGSRCCIITRYQLPPNHPMGNAIMATHVSRLLPLGGGFITDMVPLLARGLYQAGEKWPAALPQPVWAMLDAATAAQYLTIFPTARTTAMGPRLYIFHRRLSTAIADSASYRAP